MTHLRLGVVDSHLFLALQASHVDLDTNDGIYLRHDALNGRHLENFTR